MFFLEKFKDYYKGLKITTNITTISIIVGISFIILKNFDDFVLPSNANSPRYFPNKKW